LSRAQLYIEGMIIGEHTRGNDLEVNVLKGKQLTNMRAAGKDEAVQADHPDPDDAGKVRSPTSMMMSWSR
jgi:predicted membrane GTPase involved in stress response